MKRLKELLHSAIGKVFELFIRMSKLWLTLQREGNRHSESIAYPMHPVCWSIFEQNYSNLSTGFPLDLEVLAKVFRSQPLDEKGRGFQPDWSSIAYGGAEELWSYGLSWMAQFGDDYDYYDIEPENFEYFVKDPGRIQGF